MEDIEFRYPLPWPDFAPFLWPLLPSSYSLGGGCGRGGVGDGGCGVCLCNLFHIDFPEDDRELPDDMVTCVLL